MLQDPHITEKFLAVLLLRTGGICEISRETMEFMKPVKIMVVEQDDVIRLSLLSNDVIVSVPETQEH